MSNKKRLIMLIVILFIFLTINIKAQDKNDNQVAIYDFKVVNVPETVSSELILKLNQEFAKDTKGNTLVELEKVKNLITEKGFKEHPFTDLSVALQIGKELNLKYLITGGIFKKGSSYETVVKVIRIFDRKQSRSPGFVSYEQISIIDKYADYLDTIYKFIDILNDNYEKMRQKLENLKRNSMRIRKQITQSMIYVPGGTFIMGENEDLTDWEVPAHQVMMDSFYMDPYEVTCIQYSAFLTDAKLDEATMKKYVDITDPYCKIMIIEDGFIPETGYDNYPVVAVSWHGANAFAKWAKKRLPSEAEWEYAAGGKDHFKFSMGDVLDKSSYAYNTSGMSPAKSYKPNSFGLYNMTGNVMEWCNDWMQPNYYEVSPYRNPKGPAEEIEDKNFKRTFYKARVIRGGSWNTSQIHEMRIQRRWWHTPETKKYYIGFRCAR